MARRKKGGSIKSRPSVEYLPYEILTGQSFTADAAPTAVWGMQAGPTGTELPEDSFIVGGYCWHQMLSEDIGPLSFRYGLMHRTINQSAPTDLGDADELEDLWERGSLKRMGCIVAPGSDQGISGEAIWGPVLYLKLPRVKLSEDERLQLYIQSMTARASDVTYINGGKILYQRL